MENSSAFADQHNPNTSRGYKRQTMQFKRSKPHEQVKADRPKFPRRDEAANEAELLQGIASRKQEEMQEIREEQIAEREFFEMERLAYVEALDELQVKLNLSSSEGTVEVPSEESTADLKIEMENVVAEKNEALNRAQMAEEDGYVLGMERVRLAAEISSHARAAKQLEQELQQIHLKCDLLETRSCVAEEKGMELQEANQSLQGIVTELEAQKKNLSANCTDLKEKREAELERFRQEEASREALEVELKEAKDSLAAAQAIYADSCEQNGKLCRRIEELERQLSSGQTSALEERTAFDQRVLDLEQRNRSLVEAEMLQRKYILRLSERVASLP